MNDQDIFQLQLLQQNLQNIVLQKQHLQKQLAEINSALEEIVSSPSVYKIIGDIVVASEKNSLKKELEQKKEILQLRLKNFEKQEQILKEKTEETQKKVLEKVKKKNDAL